MKIIFAGTPVFAIHALDALMEAGHEIVLVLTQPDRPAGRGMKLTASPVSLLAQEHGLSVLQPESLRQPGIHVRLMDAGADIMVVVAYGLILPAPVLAIPRLGCFNIHASLLPRWRGAAPIQRSILAGDEKTGITIMQMDAGLDTGAMLLQSSLPILCEDTTQTLHDRLASIGGKLVVEALARLQQGRLEPIPQGPDVSYAPKITKAEAEIDWRQSAVSIHRAIRAFNPYPGAFSRLNGVVLKIWQASIRDKETTNITTGQPGEIIVVDDSAVAVTCGEGMLLLEIVQKPGAKRLGAADFVAGYLLRPGDRFDCRND